MNESMLEEVARLIRERTATVHERHACPRCAAPKGERCCAMPLGWGGVCAQVGVGRTLKHSHAERVQLEVPLR